MTPRASQSEAHQPTSLETHVQAVLELMRAFASEKPVPQLELEERLKVSGRTIRRYIAALKQAGFDIQTRRGQGYQLRFVPDHWRGFLPVSVLEQLATLQVVSEALPLPMSKADRNLASLIEELLGDATGDVKRVEDRLQRALLWKEEVPRQNQQATANLKLCLRAIVHLHPLRMKYTDSRNRETLRTIEPLGCLFTSGTWYCVAQDRLRKEQRNFTMERMREVEMLAQDSYRHPESFSLEREYTGAWGIWRDQKPESVEFIVEPPYSQFFIECEFPFPNKKTRKQDGRVTVRTSSANLDETARWLAPYADRLTIRLPQALRAKIAERAGETLNRHR